MSTLGDTISRLVMISTLEGYNDECRECWDRWRGGGGGGAAILTRMWDIHSIRVCMEYDFH